MLWRKLPIGIIRDEDMDYIADQLPVELQAAPYMFYLTALCKADNDGIFDLEDGVIFARLMRIGSPAIVFQIANLMMKRKLILRAGESTRCILTAWDYPAKEQPRTMEQRRAIVEKKIEQERRVAAESEFKINTATAAVPASTLFHTSNHNDGQIAAAVASAAFNQFDQAAAAAQIVSNVFCDQPGDFLCPNDDKNAKNVVEKNETEREKERIDTERIETHTETKDKRETKKLALQAFGEPAFRASTEEYTAEKLQITEIQQEEDETDTECRTNGNELPGSELQEEMANGEVNTAVFSTLVNFFTKNNLGFNKQANYPDLAALCYRIQALADNRNPPEIIAGVMLGQFKKLTEDDGYYKNAPLTPQQFLKPGMYSHALAATSKILVADKSNDKWLQQQKKYEQQVQKEKAVGNVFDNQYLKYGIDPQDPNRAAKLMQAQANESKDNEPP